MRRLWIAIGLAAAVGCASSPKKPTAAELAARARAAAQARVLEGCYDCLLEARAAYAELAVGRARPALVLPMFEVELLIILREKELAMDYAASVARAEALAAELPPETLAARLLAVVDAVPPDAMGLPQTEESAYRRSRQAFLPRINGEIAWLATASIQPAVREYLSISLDCKYLNRARAGGGPLPGQSAARDVPPGSPPIVAYRLATCDTINVPALEQVKAEVPGFADVAIFLARIEVAGVQRTGGAKARPLLAEAYAHFPRSSAVTYLNGNFQQTVGDCAEALRFYDETLALRPVHENALLGRTVCLTFLKRQDEAIVTATRMIELRTFNMHEAYFWRAWIRHDRKELPAAREDIERAKALASNNNIHRLAGIIEYDQEELDIAEKDLLSAKNMGGADCIARWYLGLVGMKRVRWIESAGHFEDAMTCYERAALFSEAALKQMEVNTEIDPEFRARQIAGFKVAVQEDRSQQYAAAYNAANHFARGGNVDKAKVLIEVAAKDPALDKFVAELRKVIGGG